MGLRPSRRRVDALLRMEMVSIRLLLIGDHGRFRDLFGQSKHPLGNECSKMCSWPGPVSPMS
jgi:hypothetical protein